MGFWVADWEERGGVGNQKKEKKCLSPNGPSRKNRHRREQGERKEIDSKRECLGTGEDVHLGEESRKRTSSLWGKKGGIRFSPNHVKLT